MKAITFACLSVAVVGCVLTIAVATTGVWAQETAAGYKIGVVDMREVFQKYDRRESQYQKLVGERDAAQQKVNALADKINTAQKDYQAKRPTLAPQDLEKIEMQILSDISNLEAERGKLQADVRLIEDKMLRDLTQDIRKAIAEIGQAENYHLILEAGGQGGPVLYNATPLSLTSKVIDRLNTQ